MSRCFVCGNEITGSQDSVQARTSYGDIGAHVECLNWLKEWLNFTSSRVKNVDILEAFGEDLIVVRREVGVKNIILAYLTNQEKPIEVLLIYDWLKKNELKVKNPSDYIAKMRAEDLVAVISTDFQGQRVRMIRITDKGRERLNSLSKEGNEEDVPPGR